MCRFLVLALSVLILAGTSHAETPVPKKPVVEKGSFRFSPGEQKDIPERFRLEGRSFDYEMDLKQRLAVLDISVYNLRFPSPVKTATVENNTVHAEYYRPEGKGPFPGVIILDVTAGDQRLSRHLGAQLAQEGIASLFVQMAYYGPRRPAGSKLRLLSPDLNHTTKAVTQTVLDLRVATAWMANRPEIDPDRLGIVGTSLGSFLSALTGEMEPRLGHVAVLLGGGGLVDAYYTHPEGIAFRAVYEALGGTKEALKKRLAPIDPLTCAANLKSRKLLIIAASRDDIVPPQMARWLWEASGKQKIVWYDTTHYGAALYLADAVDQLVKHFKER